MLRPGGLARPALARTFTTELAWAGSPRNPTSVMTGWFIVIYHRRTFTGWTGSLMGCEQRRKDAKAQRFLDILTGSVGHHRLVNGNYRNHAVRISLSSCSDLASWRL